MIRTEYYWPRRQPLQNAEVGDFVSRVIWGEPGQISFHSTMAVYDNDQLIAATAYHNWTPESGVIELSSAAISKKWLTRPVIRAMFAVPFEMLGCQMVVLRVSNRNTTMVRIAKCFGFEGVLIPRLRGRDEDEWIFTYTNEAWRASRYQEVCHRQKNSQGT